MGKVPTPVNNKRRGKRFEADLVKLLTEWGWVAKRAWGSDGRSLGYSERVDVLAVAPIANIPLRIQCKRVKKLAARYEISDDIDAVVFRGDGTSDPLILIPLATLDELIETAVTKMRKALTTEDGPPGTT